MDSSDEITRREFAKQTAVGTIIVAGAASGPLAWALPGDLSNSVVGALGAVFIPSRPGDPGYKDLEQFGITEYVLTHNPRVSQLRIAAGLVTEISGPGIIEEFNNASKQYFEGKTFLELDDQQKEQYLELILTPGKIADTKLRVELLAFYRTTKFRIMETYYKNYPEHEAKRNAQGEPILKPGDIHQITNPNTKKLVTGWDIAGYKGPLDWEEEEKRRAMMKKVWSHWDDNDLIKLDNRKPAAPAIKTSDGKDYYDVLVLGGGTGGCIVAGRLAERGINPKTGDRLRVAMLEGGDDWTVRDPGIRPGYGYPIRRRMTTNISNEEQGAEGQAPAPRYHWPWEGPDNLRLVGGMSNHYNAIVWLPQEDDFHFYREASGVDWDPAKFGDAIEEIRDLYNVTVTPTEMLNRADHIFADAARALGFMVHPTPISRRNCLDTVFCSPGTFCRYDAKGTALPWAYIGMNNGLKIIGNAEVEKVLIEKVPGGRPVATGAVYKDRSGNMHEVRAARVIVACAAIGTPLLLYRSGYGPRDLLGDRLLVENNNVGRHLSGDGITGAGAVAYFEDPVLEEGRGNWRGLWASVKPRPWAELTIALNGAAASPAPNDMAMGPFSPEFGWQHKEFMRNGTAARHIMNIGAGLRTLPWSWRVLPNNDLERMDLDVQRIDAARREAAEWTKAAVEKLPVKPLKINFGTERPAATFRPVHHSGTARAGANRETSVCNSDFDCHDIDHLLITSAASIPRTTFSDGMGPTASCAAYAWRRMIANHFSRGCSTKGFA